MAARQGSAPPWPTPTQHSYSLKSKRKWDPTEDPPPDRHRSSPRQAVPPASVTSNDCGIQGNNVISCYPRSDSPVVQNMPTRFVWNNRLPQFSQTNLVDIFLFHGDTDDQVAVWPQLDYPFGHLSVTPNDTWWGARGPLIESGKNQTQNFFFVMVVNGSDPSSGISQATFTATQTSLPTSILSSLSLASAMSASSASEAVAASSSSLASLSSMSAKASATNAGPGALQNAASSSDFPHWAIALLAVFGFLAFISFFFVFWILIRTLRRRHGNVKSLNRGSVGSQSPMMANISGAPRSPTTVAHEPQSAESHLGPLPAISGRGIVSSDGASSISHADSAGGPISNVDAAALAAAFRNVMRKPDFADRPMEEGEAPEKDVMGQELAEEGRDIRSVSSSRGVKVETLSEDGERLH
ncbi:hypothetical protein BU17DRAFT_91785 [Hysterangium stoloniferum]|nr:hypothetical protein BU17DRAFT_91785 [Hysterangium stoloniferum]